MDVDHWQGGPFIVLPNPMMGPGIWTVVLWNKLLFSFTKWHPSNNMCQLTLKMNLSSSNFKMMFKTNYIILLNLKSNLLRKSTQWIVCKQYFIGCLQATLLNTDLSSLTMSQLTSLLFPHFGFTLIYYFSPKNQPRRYIACCQADMHCHHSTLTQATCSSWHCTLTTHFNFRIIGNTLPLPMPYNCALFSSTLLLSLFCV